MPDSEGGCNGDFEVGGVGAVAKQGANYAVLIRGAAEGVVEDREESLGGC